MKTQTSKLYHYKQLLSESSQIQTWMAIDLSTGTECVLKTPTPSADTEVINSLLTASRKYQRLLTAKDILLATRKRLENGRVIIEYPVLDTAKWSCLSPALFWSNLQLILCKVCQTVDYLHISGLVHGDLKLGNFMISEERGQASITLVDLDFLCKHSSKPHSIIFGTPDHIAPEIIANERIVTQSDNFSLGVSLRRYLDQLEDMSSDFEFPSAYSQKGLLDLSEELTQQDFLRRPGFLLKALVKHDLISQSRFEAAQQELLFRILLSHWRHAGLRRGEIDISGILRNGKILGPSDGLVQRISGSLRISRLSTFRVLKTALKRAQVSRHADYWHVALGDDTLTDLYSQLQTAATTEQAEPSPTLLAPGEKPSDVLARMNHMKKSGHVELAFLTGRQLLLETKGFAANKANHEYDRIYCRMGFLAQSLNRLRDAEQYLESWSKTPDGQAEINSEPIEALMTIKLALGKSESLSELVQTRLDHVQSEPPTEHELYLIRVRGWLAGSVGDYKMAESIFAEVIRISLDQGYQRILMLTHYSQGVLFWRRGNYDQALSCLNMSLKIARQHQLMDKAVPVLSTLAIVYTELARYENAVKHGKNAATLAVKYSHDNLLPSICAGMIWAYTRLADFHKASYWTQRFLDLKRRAGSKNELYLYYSSLGFLALNMSDLDSARQYLHQGLELAANKAQAKAMGTMYTNLAHVELERGSVSSVEENVDQALMSFASAGDTASALESQLLPELGRFIYQTDQDPQPLIAVLEKLVEKNRIYYSAMALFHLLVRDIKIDHDRLGRIIEQLQNSLNSSRVPLLRATSVLLDTHLAEYSGIEQRLTSLKKATMELSSDGSKFCRFFLYRAIAEIYIEKQSYRFAGKYLQQAQQQARALSNEVLSEAIQNQLHVYQDQTESRSLMVESFHAVSRIVNDIDRPDESLHNLLQFALEETCAERAALLLKRKGSSQFYIAASLHCDQQSIDDITDISTSVTRQVLRGTGALVIENALSDDRTKDYNSIVAHNILSVACIPLMHGDDLLGVVYLDHHTVPSLFSPDDIRYISAISNFLSATLKAVQSYGHLNQANIQLKQDLLSLGESGSFVSSDPVMIALLEKLPEIAQADVPVLLLGESGTGKEIIAAMIHEKSRRAKSTMIKLNCAAIAPTMIDSELFGVAKNAATGVAEHDGKLLAATNSTLFLDEIGDMSLDAQAKLLRVVEYQQFEKIGSNRIIETDIRFVYASNKNLTAAVKNGYFRHDLYYRISTITIEIPPLRDRPGDIELLIEHFVRLFSADKPRPALKQDARKALLSYSWPGNVRELKNIIERCCILHSGQNVDSSMLPKDIRSSACDVRTELNPATEKAMILRALKDNRWIQSRAARQLDLPLSTLRRKMKKHGVEKHN